MSIKRKAGSQFRRLLHNIRYVKDLAEFRKHYFNNSCYPPGFYSSPIVEVTLIKLLQDSIWKNESPVSFPGIDLNWGGQKSILEALNVFYPKLNFPETKSTTNRYWYQNDFYSYTDAIVLSCMLQYLRPSKFVEIGSGFSTAVILDTLPLMQSGEIKITCVEPYPERLESLLLKEDFSKIDILRKDVQEIGSELFAGLEAGDILFIDSSHVSKTGSDLNYLIFEILPKLAPGVIIHFHDIFYPFEYPRSWVLEGRNWNEIYLLRAFLMYNSDFEIVLFSHLIHQLHPEWFTSMPMAYKNQGGNLWLRKK